jgi:hypothetical protein
MRLNCHFRNESKVCNFESFGNQPYIQNVYFDLDFTHTWNIRTCLDKIVIYDPLSYQNYPGEEGPVENKIKE